MKVLLIILVYYASPERKLEVLWMDQIPQETMDQCIAEGDRYKYKVEINPRIEVQYICKRQQ